MGQVGTETKTSFNKHILRSVLVVFVNFLDLGPLITVLYAILTNLKTLHNDAGRQHNI